MILVEESSSRSRSSAIIRARERARDVGVLRRFYSPTQLGLMSSSLPSPPTPSSPRVPSPAITEELAEAPTGNLAAPASPDLAAEASTAVLCRRGYSIALPVDQQVGSLTAPPPLRSPAEVADPTPDRASGRLSPLSSNASKIWSRAEPKRFNSPPSLPRHFSAASCRPRQRVDFVIRTRWGDVGPTFSSPASKSDSTVSGTLSSEVSASLERVASPSLACAEGTPSPSLEARRD